MSVYVACNIKRREATKQAEAVVEAKEDLVREGLEVESAVDSGELTTKDQAKAAQGKSEVKLSEGRSCRAL